MTHGRMLAFFALMAAALALPATAAAPSAHLYRIATPGALYLDANALPKRLQVAIDLALDRHAVVASYPHLPRWSFRAVRPAYLTTASLVRARQLAAPWLGTEVGVNYRTSTRAAAEDLAYQISQIGLVPRLVGSHGIVTNPPSLAIGLGLEFAPYRGYRVPGIRVAEVVDHVAVSRRVGCFTYVRYVGVDLASLCIR